LNPAKKHQAIVCDSEWGPNFSGIAVSDNCNANTGSWTGLGSIYNGNTGLGRYTGFTDSEHFQVKEIEVFEITD
jgi:hypothetical protein